MKKGEIIPNIPWLAQTLAQVAQARIQGAQGLRNGWLLLACVLGLSACSGSGALRAVSGIPADAVLEANGRWLVFRLAQESYAEVSRKALPRTESDWEHPERWRKLAAPSRPFRPVQVSSGPPGHFYVMDAAGRRLLLYDAQGHLLSRYPLPQELAERPLDRLRFAYFPGGRYAFWDSFSREAWSFQERTGVTNASPSGGWQLLGRYRLPIGLTDCGRYVEGPALLCRLSAEPMSKSVPEPVRLSPVFTLESGAFSDSGSGMRFDGEWHWPLGAKSLESERPDSTWHYFPGRARIQKAP